MKAATLTQVRRGRGGRMIQIEGDVLDLVKRLHEIDTSLGLDWNDAGEYFRVFQHLEDGRKVTVTTSNELDVRLLDRVLKVVHPSYDPGKEAERLDDLRDREIDHRFSEEVGERGERLAHALRKDFQYGGKIFVPRGVS